MAEYGKLFSTEHVERGNFEDAIAAAKQEIENDPIDPEPLFNRGRALVGLERFKEGVADLERAATLDASESDLEVDDLDDTYFEALREWAEQTAPSNPEKAIELLNRYLELYSSGRHRLDIAKWEDHFRGVSKTWVKNG